MAARHICTALVDQAQFGSNIFFARTIFDLPVEPPATPPATRLRFPTGALCTIHGRYREAGFVTPPAFDRDIAPMVVLLPGDVFPWLLKLGQHGQLLARKRIKWELIATL